MNLRPVDRERLLNCFHQVFHGDASLWAYGSRVKNTSHDASDLDLVLMPLDSSALPGHKISKFRKLLQESPIPFLVQVQNWSMLPESFRKQILAEKVRLA